MSVYTVLPLSATLIFYSVLYIYCFFLFTLCVIV